MVSTAATGETEFLTVAEVAERLRVSAPTIYRRVQDGTLPVVRLTEMGAIRIPASTLDQFARPSESPVRAPRTSHDEAVGPPAHGGGHREEEA